MARTRVCWKGRGFWARPRRPRNARVLVCRCCLAARMGWLWRSRKLLTGLMVFLPPGSNASLLSSDSGGGADYRGPPGAAPWPPAEVSGLKLVPEFLVSNVLVNLSSPAWSVDGCFPLRFTRGPMMKTSQI